LKTKFSPQEELMFSQEWAQQAFLATSKEDKQSMYELAARAVDDTDWHHGLVLRRIAMNWGKRD